MRLKPEAMAFLLRLRENNGPVGHWRPAAVGDVKGVLLDGVFYHCVELPPSTVEYEYVEERPRRSTQAWGTVG